MPRHATLRSSGIFHFARRLRVVAVCSVVICLSLTVPAGEPDLNRLALAAAADLHVSIAPSEGGTGGPGGQALAIFDDPAPAPTSRIGVPTLADLRDLVVFILGNREVAVYLGAFAGAAIVLLLAWWRITSAVGSENRAEVEEWERY